MAGTIVAIILVALLGAYVIGIFVWDGLRKKKGIPSIFLDACESEGHGKRLIKSYHKAYGKKGGAR